MYLVVTRSFPPEIGGMQNLMWGLTNELSKNYMIKVFADYHENHKIFDEQVSFSIERVGGIKLFRKYRKAQLINEFTGQEIFPNFGSPISIPSATPTLIIPIEYSIKIDGISGILPYNIFRIPDDRLPKQYRGKVDFAVFSINHEIESNKWYTILRGQIVIRN